MDDAGPPSLFVVAYYGPYYNDEDPPYISILKVDTPELKEQQPRTTQQIKTAQVDVKDLVKIHFNKEPVFRPPVRWLISPPTSSTEDLYVVPNWGFYTAKPLQSYKFDLRAGTSKPIPPPLSSAWAVREGHVVTVERRIYFLGYYWDGKTGEQSYFQCYDPDKNSWKALQPFPHNQASLGPIVATAVWDNTILLNLAYNNIMAYDVSKNKWLVVNVVDNRCFHMIGEAIVLGDILYTLTDEPGSFNLVLELTIEKKAAARGDVVVLEYSSQNLVPDMKPINVEDALDQDICSSRTRHLVHLGGDNFCLVQSCYLDSVFEGYQDIKVTYIKVKGEISMIFEECMYKVKWPFNEQFDVVHCFSLPKCKTTALEDGKSFNLNPFPEAVRKEEASQANIINNPYACSAYARELPPRVRTHELEMGLKEIGFVKVYMEKHPALVEFENASSKQLAVEVFVFYLGFPLSFSL